MFKKNELYLIQQGFNLEFFTWRPTQQESMNDWYMQGTYSAFEGKTAAWKRVSMLFQLTALSKTKEKRRKVCHIASRLEKRNSKRSCSPFIFNMYSSNICHILRDCFKVSSHAIKDILLSRNPAVLTRTSPRTTPSTADVVDKIVCTEES